MGLTTCKNCLRGFSLAKQLGLLTEILEKIKVPSDKTKKSVIDAD